MPTAQRVRSSASGATPELPLNGHYPKYLVGESGSVWIVTAPKTGTLLVLGNQPFRNKTVDVGYSTTKLKEGKGLRPFHGSITINVD